MTDYATLPLCMRSKLFLRLYFTVAASSSSWVQYLRLYLLLFFFSVVFIHEIFALVYPSFHSFMLPFLASGTTTVFGDKCQGRRCNVVHMSVWCPVHSVHWSKCSVRPTELILENKEYSLHYRRSTVQYIVYYALYIFTVCSIKSTDYSVLCKVFCVYCSTVCSVGRRGDTWNTVQCTVHHTQCLV